ncbi:MAG: hypothetical protein NXY57DRAFT_1040457 [Lentinula lateritia]|nr:MAG: hypothetical protein NXY57DRAFT_1040457 [Lentinula lateritia]
MRYFLLLPVPHRRVYLPPLRKGGLHLHAQRANYKREHPRNHHEIHIEGLKAQYEAQLREAETLREQRRQQIADAERLAAVEQQEKEKELAKEAEKKKKNGCRSTASRKGLGNRFHYKSTHTLYAKKMMTARKYVPLWYFLPEAATEAKERSKDSLDTDHLQFAVEDGDTLSGSTISLVGSHTVRASPNAIPDSRLSWFQVMRAKSAFLNTLRLGAWPDDHISMFVALYINMDMHSELQEQDGHRGPSRKPSRKELEG